MLLIGIILVIGIVGAFQIITFSNLLNLENLYYSGNEDITRNISISKYVNITSGYMNLSGLLLAQHIPNQYECRIFNGENQVADCTNIFDYNDSNYAYPIGGSTNFFNANYTTPDTYNLSDLRFNVQESYTDVRIFNYSSNSWNTLHSASYPWINHLTSYGITNDNINNKTIQLSFYKYSNSNTKIYEISMFWGNSSSYVTNPSVFLTDYEIWSYSGIFTGTNVTTSSFASELNGAINKGKCDCTGCSLSGNNCSVPFIFHSDSNGILQYSNLNINYDTIPYVNYKFPIQNGYSSISKTFSCNSTDEINLKNVTLYIWNSTGLYNNSESRIITGKDNYTTFNPIIFNSTDTYKWNCLVYNNNSYSNMFDSNYTLFVDVSSPVVTMIYPSNNQWINTGTNVNFNCSVEGPQLDSVFLWGNFTGIWSLNQTKSGITSGTTNTFLLNLPDNKYLWTCNANKSTDATIYYSPYGNYQVNIDTIFPVLYDLHITPIINTNQLYVLTNITDLNLDSCKYSIWTGSTPGNNISLPCNNNTLINAPGFGVYTLYVYAKDLAGNENSQNLQFITSVAPGGTSSGGSLTPINAVTDWTMTSDGNTGNYRLIMTASSERTKELVFLNTGTSEKTVILNCESITNLCDYIYLDNLPIKLPVLKDITLLSTFTIKLPVNYTSGTYNANIYALDTEGNKQIVTLEVVVGPFNFLTTIFSKLGDYKYIGDYKIPYFIILILMGILSFLPLIFISKTLGKEKRSFFNLYGTSLSVLLSIIIAFIVVILI